MKRIILAIALFSLTQEGWSQNKYVAITMDDMPFHAVNKSLSINEIKRINDAILQQITQSKTPVAAFINGDGCWSREQTDLRLTILKSWLDHPLIISGSHTWQHLNAANESLDRFKEDVISNEYLLKPLSKDSLHYFRFPYNALGQDSISQKERADFLTQRGYTIAPFTIESADYLFNAMYVNELTKGDKMRADSIAKNYIKFTVDLFRYFETLSQELYARNICHIYLCHANQLHADYYYQLIQVLKAEGYQFITLDAALKDDAYKQPLNYYKKFGVSWMYRWMKDPKERKKYMMKEPEVNEKLYKEYQLLTGEK